MTNLTPASKHSTPWGTRKIISFVFLFILFFSTFMGVEVKPAKAATSAGSILITCLQSCRARFPGQNEVCGLAHWFSVSNSCSQLAACLGKCYGTTTVTDCIDSFSTTKEIVAGLTLLVEWIPKTFAQYATKLTTYVMDTVLNWPITNPGAVPGVGASASAAFVAGWLSTRNLANMLIVLGFVIVGIATALRIQEYAAKKFLWPLIIIALLVNFSGLFCGLIIDASHLTMTGLLQADPSAPKVAATQSRTGIDFMFKINQIETTKLCDLAQAKPDGKLLDFMSASGLFTLLYLIIAIAFFFLAIMLIVRYAVLGMLFMLSPLAFAFWAFPFPKAKDLWNRWWAAFLKWAFIGVGICFFLNLAAGILGALDTGDGRMYTDMTVLVINMFIVISVIITGIVISVKSSGVAGVAAMAVGGFVGAKIMGAAGGGAKMLGNTKAGSFVKDKARNLSTGAGKAMERVGLRQSGSTAARNSKQVEEKSSLMSKEYAAAKATGDTKSMARIQKTARVGRGAEGAAAMKTVADAKDLHATFGNNDADLGKMADRMSYAESAGATGIRESAEKLDPRLKRHNIAAVNKAMSSTPGLSRPDAENKVVDEGFAKANVGDIRNFSEETLSHPAFIKNTPMNKISKAAEEMSGSKIKAIQVAHTPTIEAQVQESSLAGSKPDIAKHKDASQRLSSLKTL